MKSLRTMAPRNWAFGLLFLFGSAAAQVDLSRYDLLHVQVTTATNKEFPAETAQLSALLIGYFRGTNRFSEVGFARDGARSGVRLEIVITSMRVVGGGARFLGGALMGKDQLAADVRYRDLDTGSVLAETSVDGQGKGGFIWNIGGATISAALLMFSKSLMEWSGYPAAVFGIPKNWRGVLNRDTPVSLRCSGIDERSKMGGIGYLKQSDGLTCSLLEDALRNADIRVAESSSTVLHLSVEDYNGGTTGYDSLLIGRWRIESAGAVVHDDVLVSFLPANGRSRGRLSKNATEVVRLHTQTGVDALRAAP